MDKREMVAILMERMNSLETILVSTLLGFLLTATFALVAASQHSAGKGPLKENPRLLLLGVNALYIFLSGYYYFMLTHFYATASILVSLTNDAGISHASDMWTMFRFPSFPLFLSDSTRGILYLMNAPLFPFLFSSSAIAAVFFLTKSHIRSKWHKRVFLPVSCAVQLAVCYAMIYDPFIHFLSRLQGK